MFKFLFLLFALPTVLFAEVLPGWQHTTLNDAARTVNGVLLEGGNVGYSSPAVGDLDGNPDNGLETAILTADAVLNVVNSSGALMWSAKLPNSDCTKTGDENKGFSAPAIAELFKDGKKYVVVGYGGIGGKDCGGGVVAHDGATGARRWHFNLVRFSKKENFSVPIAYSVFSSPVIADINRDGYPEIAFGSYDRNVYVLNARGKPVWYYHAADTVWSSGTFVQVNNKGRLELLIGTDITGNPHFQPAIKNGGYLYAFKIKTKRVKKKRALRRPVLTYRGFQDRKAYIWRTHFDQVVHSSPVVADVLPNIPGDEIVVGTGCFYPEGTESKTGKHVSILSLATGKVLKKLETDVCVSATPAIADIDEDGKLEVVITSVGSATVGSTGKSKVTAWNPEDGSVLWQTIPITRSFNDRWAGHFASPVIADLDKNGSLEVISSNHNSMVILAGKTGEQVSCQDVICDEPGIEALNTGGIIRGTPAIADINADGTLDLVSASKRSYLGTNHGALFAWTNLADSIVSEPGILTPNMTPWPMAQGSVDNNSVVR